VEQASSELVLKRYILAQPIKVIDPPARCSKAGRKTLLYLFKSTPKKGAEKHPEKSAFSSRLRGNWNPPRNGRIRKQRIRQPYTGYKFLNFLLVGS
jgi:hypothetical protein